MKGAPNDGARALGLSIFLHGALIAALAVGLLSWHKPPQPAAPAVIEATLVTAGSAAPVPEPEPQPQQVPEPQPAPDVEQRQLEQQAEQQARAQREAEQKAVDAKAAEQKLAEQKAAEIKTEQARAEKERAEQARAEKAKAEREKAAKLEAERKETERKKADELARQQTEKQRADRERELHAQLAAEERVNAVRASGQMAEYVALIKARVERNWIRPPGATPGLNCQVKVTQVPGGTVSDVKVTSCNGDEAARASIEAAVYRASPLPVPSDPALFDRNLNFNFAPRD